MKILETIKKAVGIHERIYIHGIEITRYGASWLNAGGNFYDKDGFIDWMTNLLFINDRGFTVIISKDEAEMAYSCMTGGKFELECAAKKYLGI